MFWLDVVHQKQALCLAACNSDFELNFGIKRYKPALITSIIIRIRKHAGFGTNRVPEKSIRLFPGKDLSKFSKVKMLNRAIFPTFAPYLAIGL